MDNMDNMDNIDNTDNMDNINKIYFIDIKNNPPLCTINMITYKKLSYKELKVKLSPQSKKIILYFRGSGKCTNKFYPYDYDVCTNYYNKTIICGGKKYILICDKYDASKSYYINHSNVEHIVFDYDYIDSFFTGYSYRNEMLTRKEEYDHNTFINDEVLHYIQSFE